MVLTWQEHLTLNLRPVHIPPSLLAHPYYLPWGGWAIGGYGECWGPKSQELIVGSCMLDGDIDFIHRAQESVTKQSQVRSQINSKIYINCTFKDFL